MLTRSPSDLDFDSPSQVCSMGRNLFLTLLAALMMLVVPVDSMAAIGEDIDGQLIAMSSLSPGRFPSRPANSSVQRRKSKAKKATSAIRSSKKALKAVSRKKVSTRGKASVSRKRSSKSVSRAKSPRRSTKKVSKTRRHRASKSRKKRHRASASNKVDYKYPVKTFMWKGPELDTTPLSLPQQREISKDFNAGIAGRIDPGVLVRAKVFSYYPMRGGITNRISKVKFIIAHSTETARPADAKRVIRSWSNMGLRHAGTQFVVDRDGMIYMTVHPDYSTSHVDVYRTLYGVTNDNSVGIEMVHTGKQVYTQEQWDSMTRLVSYLQDRYKVSDRYVVRHGTCQPSTRTDPVNFDWTAFHQGKARLRALAAGPRKAKKPMAMTTQKTKPAVATMQKLKPAVAATQRPKPAIAAISTQKPNTAVSPPAWTWPPSGFRWPDLLAPAMKGW
jgi:N-acetyl-anhydromuramyl-L-alanine amidase AmpD